MKSRFKRIFENSAYWMGVIVMGLIVGVSIQFARAWVGPTADAPNGNVGAPINTGMIMQWKDGLLGALRFQTGESVDNGDGTVESRLRVIPSVAGKDIVGKALVAINNDGDVAFANSGTSTSAAYTYIKFPHQGWIINSSVQPKCPDSFTTIAEYSTPLWGSYNARATVCSSVKDPAVYPKLCFYWNGGWPSNCAPVCDNGYDQVDEYNSYLAQLVGSQGYDGDSSHMYLAGMHVRMCQKR
ncbi:MAG: hypothetical protein HGB08_01255 [Candidatus Moranbacteria bacterium]|nr:hypothetical protein [Candidatus Moranbacteria bacterium]